MIAKNMRINLLITLFLAGIAQPEGLVAKPSEDIATAGLVVAGVGLAVAGVASLVGWATSQSDESYLESAQNEYHSILNKYNAYYQSELDLFLEISAVPDLFSSSDEAHLYKIACVFAKLSMTVHVHCRDLSSWVSTLANYRSGLTKRINQRPQSKHRHDNIVDAMCTLRRSIASLEANIKLPRDFYTRHAAYFALFEREVNLQRLYEKELDDYRHNRLEAFENISRYQITRDYRKYPFIFYVDSLESDLCLFKTLINKAFPYYSDRVQAAERLYSTLYDIKNRVENTTGYAADVRQKQHDELEAKRLALLKEQLSVREHEMHILEKQVQLKREEIERQEREIRRQQGYAHYPKAAEFSTHVHVRI